MLYFVHINYKEIMNPESETHSENTTPIKRTAAGNSLGIPIAIVIAAALIAGAIYFSGSGTGPAARPKRLCSQADTHTMSSPDRFMAFALALAVLTRAP